MSNVNGSNAGNIKSSAILPLASLGCKCVTESMTHFTNSGSFLEHTRIDDAMNVKKLYNFILFIHIMNYSTLTKTLRIIKTSNKMFKHSNDKLALFQRPSHS